MPRRAIPISTLLAAVALACGSPARAPETVGGTEARAHAPLNRMDIYLAKLATQLASPLSVSIGLGALSLALLGLRRAGLAAGALAVSLGLLWLASAHGVALALARTLEAQHPPIRAEDAEPAGAIVLLGGAVRAREPGEPWSDLGPGVDRVVHAARLYRAGKAPWLVASDGSMPWASSPVRPAAETADLLVEWGVPREAILVEERSRNTYENARETRELLSERGIRDVLLVTSALHMPRALAVFRSQDSMRSRPPRTTRRSTDRRARPCPWLPSATALGPQRGRDQGVPGRLRLPPSGLDPGSERRLELEDLRVQRREVEHGHGVVALEVSRALAGIHQQRLAVPFDTPLVIVAVDRDVAVPQRFGRELARIVNHQQPSLGPREAQRRVYDVHGELHARRFEAVALEIVVSKDTKERCFEPG